MGEARNQTSSPVSPTEVEEGTRTSPGTARGEGRQNTPMHVQGQGTGDHRVTLPYLSSEVAALGIYQPKAKYSYKGTALGSNQPKLTLKTNLSPEGETLGAYQPKANSSQRGPICGVNQPELTHKANLSPEGGMLRAYQPKEREDNTPPCTSKDPKSEGGPRETTPGSILPSKTAGIWQTRQWTLKRQRSVERNLTRSSPCHARLKRLQLKAHTRQIWSRIEGCADADIDIINLSRRTLSPSEL